MPEDLGKAQDESELPRLEDRLVASAAARLDAAKIPYILWGNYMLTIFGSPTVVDVRTSRQSELTHLNICPRASISSLTIISWTPPMTLFKVLFSKSAG
jgi:hypothetical protein